MSGYQANLISDSCFLEQQAKDSTKLFNNRDFQRYAYENSMNTNLLATCDGKYAHIECKACKFNDGSITNTIDNLKYRVEIENDLMGIERLNTKCDSNKFKPCYADNCSKGNNGCSYIKSVNQPLLCERAIVQTNMRPFTTGFIF